MIYEIRPRDDMCKQRGIAAIPCRDTLHVGCQSRMAVQRLAALDFVRHLAHIPGRFAGVLSPAVKPYYFLHTGQVRKVIQGVGDEVDNGKTGWYMMAHDRL